MIGIVVSFALGMIAGAVGLMILLKWAFEVELTEHDKRARQDKKNLERPL